ncbi:MAG: protein BatD [Armatimonadetes bacterium]|nr:protein BatD [Armatimonadota bacterium]
MVRLLLLLLLFYPLQAAAQEVRFEASIEPASVALGEHATLTVRISGTESSFPDPQMPEVDGLILQPAGTSRHIEIINGRFSSQVAHTYLAAPTRAGRFAIPPFRLRLDDTLYTTEELALTVTPGVSVPSPPSAPSENSAPAAAGRLLFVEAEASPRKAYVNQPIHYVFRLYHGVQLRGNPRYEPLDTTGFISRDLEQQAYTDWVDGVRMSVSQAETVLFATAPGKYSLGPTRIQCEIDPYSMFNLLADVDTGDLTLAGRTKNLETRPIEVEVLPVPAQGRPESFTGAVGQYTLRGYLDREKVKTGEPVVLTITVEGQGNVEMIDDIKLPPFPGIQAYDTESQSTMGDEVRGKKTFKTTLIPTEPGARVLSGIRFAYFDPEAEKFEELSIPDLELEVTGPLAAGRAAKTASKPPSPEDTPPAISEQGLRHIHTGGRLSRERQLLRQPVFLIVLAIPLLALGAVYGKEWLARLRHGQEPLWRRSRALATARSHLKKVADYAAIPQAVHSYLADRLNLASRGMSLRELRQALASRGVSEELGRELTGLLEVAEGARYGPGDPRSAAAAKDRPAELGRKAAELLRKLEAVAP